MPKYYVKSGQIKYIIDCNDPQSAILAALHHYKDKKIYKTEKICVSETGFIDTKTWTRYDIDDYLRKL